MSNTTSFPKLRTQMVEALWREGIQDTAVLQAMNHIPRERFVLAAYEEQAYEDRPLPILARQTISQPYIVAYMLTVLALKSTDKVLEIGTGSGYEAAVLSQLVHQVFSVEREEKLVYYARQRLAQFGYANVQVKHGDGTLGWADNAPYEAIVVSAGSPSVPPSLQQQLAVNGRLVIPVGTSLHHQHLLKITRLSIDKFHEVRLKNVSFVPLVGAEGWAEADEPWLAYFK